MMITFSSFLFIFILLFIIIVIIIINDIVMVLYLYFITDKILECTDVLFTHFIRSGFTRVHFEFQSDKSILSRLVNSRAYL